MLFVDTIKNIFKGEKEMSFLEDMICQIKLE
ncbi:hypothetical protein ADO05_01934 [Streptococcus parauberis]|nr:hypothetical protein ADO05_01934 [Streptococcus parauberis]POS67315.1 hypothetical protein AOS90_01175 [Streptococcus parauberis]